MVRIFKPGRNAIDINTNIKQAFTLALLLLLLNVGFLYFFSTQSNNATSQLEIKLAELKTLFNANQQLEGQAISENYLLNKHSANIINLLLEYAAEERAVKLFSVNVFNGQSEIKGKFTNRIDLQEFQKFLAKTGSGQLESLNNNSFTLVFSDNETKNITDK